MPLCSAATMRKRPIFILPFCWKTMAKILHIWNVTKPLKSSKLQHQLSLLLGQTCGTPLYSDWHKGFFHFGASMMAHDCSMLVGWLFQVPNIEVHYPFTAYLIFFIWVNEKNVFLSGNKSSCQTLKGPILFNLSWYKGPNLTKRYQTIQEMSVRPYMTPYSVQSLFYKL